jgi:hypothetical protein
LLRLITKPTATTLLRPPPSPRRTTVATQVSRLEVERIIRIATIVAVIRIRE